MAAPRRCKEQEQSMARFGFGYGYVSAAERQAKARRQLEKLRKKNPDITPVVVSGRKIAKTWWGMAWINNLKSYADYSNRIARGSAYVTSGMVLDLKIAPGHITAVVAGSGSKPYDVEVTIQDLPASSWKAITAACGNSIASIDELAAGAFPKELESLFTQKGKGLFPSPKEIGFCCSCPDWAYMCKHVAAAMYAAGARLDEDPLLFFTLRNIDFNELLRKSVTKKMESMLKNADRKTKRVLENADINGLFGL
jgi:uncharacterized Zn finger protein